MKNKKLLIIIGISIVIIIGIILIFSSDTNEKLSVECERKVSFDGLDSNFFVQVYRDGKSLKLILTNENKMGEKLLSQFSSLDNLAKIYEAQQKEQIKNTFGENYEYVVSNVESTNSSVIVKNTYYINEESYENIYLAFDYNFFEATNEDIKNYFERDEYSCKVY